MNRTKYSDETLDRMKANADAAKKRLERLNNEYLLRQKVRSMSRSKGKDKTGAESFAEAVVRIARENHLTI